MPEAIQQFFLLEEKLALALCTEPVFLVREQSSGMRMWVKLSDGSEESLQRLANEADVLRSISHPHIIGLKIDKRDFEVPFIGFPWQAEKPLADIDPDSLSGPDRLRIAMGILEVIQYLHGLERPVAHGRINSENFWVSPMSSWVRLASFGHARLNADAQDILADREQAINMLSDLLGRGNSGEELKDHLLELGLPWMENPASGTEELLGQLRRSFLSTVTADLQAIS